MGTYGLHVLARSMTLATRGSGKGFAYGNSWQYHPRSDRHSKIACWAILFDLVLRTSALSRHIRAGKVSFGINHRMRDFRNNREKDLDLVICKRADPQPASGITDFTDMIGTYSIVLDAEETRLASELPVIPVTEVRTALIALEAKAAMTEFGKARPRLYDELNSSQLTIHGDTDSAIAAGFAIVNAADTFVSPLKNPWLVGPTPARVNAHKQPRDAVSVVEKIQQLPRRSAMGSDGFDALGVAVIRCTNDGAPVTIESSPPAPRPGDMLFYENFLERIETIYATRFGSI